MGLGFTEVLLTLLKIVVGVMYFVRTASRTISVISWTQGHVSAGYEYHELATQKLHVP